jgi:hypothetical protein
LIGWVDLLEKSFKTVALRKTDRFDECTGV